MRNSDLSLQVSQARREADEFYKTGLERNIDAVALENQVSLFSLRAVCRVAMIIMYLYRLHVMYSGESDVCSAFPEHDRDRTNVL